ncbi:MAG: cytochrome-c peroxidase [Acidobacteria bacterium]|nr:cytochrome-c peroxidase [Acidobacteriota bacterium]
MRPGRSVSVLAGGLVCTGLGLSLLLAEGLYKPVIPLGLDQFLPVADSNILTLPKVELGRKLFLDKRLSRDRTIACASCHVPEKAFANGERVAVGIQGRRGFRNVPILFNRAYGSTQFWDGRAASLEDQVLEPIQNRREMDMTLEELRKRLGGIPEYRKEFETVFGKKPEPANVAKAIASFVRTLLAANSAFDRFDHGEHDALSEQARRGLELFRGRGNCIACHRGPNFTDERFHNTGVAWHDGRLTDEGRFAVSRNERDRGAFKTPTLREVARSAPYMHDGSLETLEDVVDFYSEGGRENPYLDPEIRASHFSAEDKRALVAFLRSLTGYLEKHSM